jgi:hypothetical protein
VARVDALEARDETVRPWRPNGTIAPMKYSFVGSFSTVPCPTLDRSSESRLRA